MKGRVLVVDDDQAMCELVHAGLSKRDYEVEWCTTGNEAVQKVQDSDYDVLVSDLKLDDMDGLALCERVTVNHPDLPVIVITAFGSMESAIAAIRAGAYDFITKPVDMEPLSIALDRAVQHRHLREEVKRLREATRQSRDRGKMVGESPAMRRVYDLVDRVGSSDASVLITGESGTGKELVAEALHSQSQRREGPFVVVNCAAVPGNLLESELFGHVKGAFTDARNARQGLFQEAHGGTIFLDEIAEMPMEMQPKLLRVLQTHRARPVGGNAEVSFDTRIVAATNRDLEAEVEGGNFREDLYYRINVVPIHVPPLRGRGNDILLLAQSFLEKAAQRMGKEVTGISSEAAAKLLEYEWPGNVRELENSIERAVILTRFDRLTVDDLPDKIRDYRSSQLVIGGNDPEDLPTLEVLERRYINRVLKAAGGNKTQAARMLGLDRRTLYRKLDRYQEAADAESRA